MKLFCSRVFRYALALAIGGLIAAGSSFLSVAAFAQTPPAITPGFVITTFAGTGTPGYSGDGGPATSAEFNGPTQIAIDKAGNVYIVDRNNNCIRKVDTNGIITT